MALVGSHGQAVALSAGLILLGVGEREISAVWNFTLSEADEIAFKNGLVWCVYVNSEAYRNECDSLTEFQINLLKAIAHGERMLSSADTMKKYRLRTSANVVKNKKVLANMDVINISRTTAEFQDPLFKIWFTENYKE